MNKNAVLILADETAFLPVWSNYKHKT